MTMIEIILIFSYSYAGVGWTFRSYCITETCQDIDKTVGENVKAEVGFGHNSLMIEFSLRMVFFGHDIVLKKKNRINGTSCGQRKI